MDADRFLRAVAGRLPPALAEVLVPALDARIDGRAVRIAVRRPIWRGVLDRHGMPAIAAAAAELGLHPAADAPAAPPRRLAEDAAAAAAPADEPPGLGDLLSDPGNRLAIAACRRAVEAPGLEHNPIYVHGPRGSGKSHLLLATAAEARRSLGDAAVIAISGADLSASLAQQLAEGDTPLRRDLEQAALIIVDDVDAIADRPLAQEELFHLINRALDQGQQLVLAGRQPPRRLAGLEERLTTRLAWGLVVALEPPHLETRAALLRRLAGPAAPPAAEIDRLVEQHGHDFHRIAELARSLRDGRPAAPAPAVSVDRIIELVAERLRLKPADIAGKRRHQAVVTARQLVFWLARRHTDHGVVALGALLGGRDHATVLHAMERAEQRLAADPAFRALAMELSRDAIA